MCSLSIVKVISRQGIERKRDSMSGFRYLINPLSSREITQFYLDMHSSWSILFGPPWWTHSQGHNCPPTDEAERCCWNHLWCFNSLVKICLSPLPWTCAFPSCNWKLNESSKWHSQSLHHWSLTEEGRSFGQWGNKFIYSSELDIFEDSCTLKNANLILSAL